MTDSDLHQHIEDIRRQLGRKLLILGHHYQREEVLRHTDLQGDSFQLSAAAAKADDCGAIIFCGVHFMAETADILANSKEKLAQRSGRRVNVVLPEPEAGCSMADMATLEAVERCWENLGQSINLGDVVPVTYVNSTAELKAFCGRHSGYACTSTNARSILTRALGTGGQKRVLFFPDQHLGRNTALRMNIPESQMVLWNDTLPDFGGNTDGQIKNSRIILWDGYCCVHQKFVPEHVDAIREVYAGIKVIVHPECRRDVVEKADEAGSTAFILKTVSESSAGSFWAVGTESRFVERLAMQNSDKTVVNLAFQPSYCDNMGLIDLPKLAAALDSVAAGDKRNVIRVDEAVAESALCCLTRMMQ
ncbi:MAG: quinolinate synthase NadA [Planctomycetaceae bacterium]|jgi:quinolinate synthase|nr:quinolinate synthase NadA [Planctomycetaceae bacterium]